MINSFISKRGQELSLNVLIVIIILIIVLIVIAFIFLGGSTTLTRQVRSTLYGATSGTDKDFAVRACEQRCESAKNMPSEELRKNSAFCKTGFEIDLDNSGNVDKDDERDVKCKDLGITCFINGKDACV